MISITSITPSLGLTPYVHSIEIVNRFDATSPIVLPPTGYVYLILFAKQSRFHIKVSGREFHHLPRAIFLGQHHGPTVLTPCEFETNYRCILFKPTALRQLWGVTMNELTDKITNAEDVLGSKLTSVLNQLQQEEAEFMKLQLLNYFLEQAVDNQHKKYVHSENVVSFMVHKNGVASIREIADYFQCRPRFLEKKFNEQVGVSPKYLNRVIQFNKALSLLHYSPEIKWTDLAYLAGYYDQAHIIKAFIEFTGSSPVQYIKSESRFIRTYFFKNADRKIVTPI